MIAGIGIDILSLARFKSLLLKRDPSKLAKRICTVKEYELFSELSHEQSSSGRPTKGEAPSNEEGGLIDHQLRFLSCRWALKEAAYKSLSPHLPGITWKDLQITHSPIGSLVLYPTRKEYRERFELLGSLSHDAGMVVGVVIAQFKGRPGAEGLA
ncbi:hypothetical protein I302_108053 [Kwoniella bestiolae CBS 10118]|uniref:4'-phosphopantetheinyl transferase domain-containing protein n=1 Tax=Kwoniella bestiolae CBS 10118 TaxID=1296100 RepID=A0A1B9FWT1_9TREE|nr:hypothetical protein I302_07581 [Kwoniella bestiolae CBS 10118]OCF23227.1 hypothetical protein I302_07581 [Kwoniella bestiolae CBS 10118]